MRRIAACQRLCKRVVSGDLAGLVFAVPTLLFLWLPLLLLFGGALSYALVQQPALLLKALPLAPLQRHLLANTIALGTATAVLAVLLGLPAGILMARSRNSVSWALGLLCALPLTLPPLLPTFAWLEVSRTPPAALMASYAATRFEAGNGVARAALLLALCFYPLIAFAACAALRAVPTEWEEAARLHDGGTQLYRRILLPLMAPALLGAAGVAAALAMWEMGAPDLLDVRTYSVEIYRNLSAGDGLHEADKFVHATLLGVPMLFLGMVALWPALRALRLAGERAVYLPAGGPRSPQLPRRSHPLLIVAAWSVVALCPLAPLLAFAVQLRPPQVLLQTWRDNSAEIGNTIAMSGFAALFMTLIACCLAASWRHWSPRARGAAVLLHVAPVFASPILLGLALVQFYNRPQFAALYGGAALTGRPALDLIYGWLARYGMEIIGYGARFLPLAVLLAVEAVRRVDPAALDAAQGLGATPAQLRRSILLPLLAPALAAIAVLLFTLCGAELATTVLVQQPGGQPLAVPLFQLMHIFDLPAVAALCLTLAGMGALAFGMAALVIKWRKWA